MLILKVGNPISGHPYKMNPNPNGISVHLIVGSNALKFGFTQIKLKIKAPENILHVRLSELIMVYDIISVLRITIYRHEHPTCTDAGRIN